MVGVVHNPIHRQLNIAIQGDKAWCAITELRGLCGIQKQRTRIVVNIAISRQGLWGSTRLQVLDSPLTKT